MLGGLKASKDGQHRFHCSSLKEADFFLYAVIFQKVLVNKVLRIVLPRTG